VATTTKIDRARCAERLEREIALLSAPPYSRDAGAVTRYAFSEPYMRTLEHLSERLEELDFEVSLDPVGNLVARNCPADVAAIGLGSHCDSVRGGGRFDGMLGVLAAIEVARESQETGLGLPLQIVSWVEEEASGFGHMLLGSKIAAGLMTERALREEIRAIDDARPFWEHARRVGLRPEQLAEVPSVLESMSAWIELHIEQARVLEDAGEQIGVVDAIAGYVHVDLHFEGQTDHAGATPMSLRHDALVVAAATACELETLARSAGADAVGTVGEVEVAPGIINGVPGRVRISLDVRATEQGAIDAVLRDVRTYAEREGRERGVGMRYDERQRVAPTPLDERVCASLERAADGAGARWRRMMSGAAHDTMCIAPFVPSAMLFIPCVGGISHSPLEDASPDDAALGVEIVLAAVRELSEELGTKGG
jgi:allantoate deiminase